ncbi:hypothetical protein ACH47Z_42660 [Streptomyces sp. NPDC020192]
MSPFVRGIDAGGGASSDPAAAREHLTIGGRSAVSTPAEQHTSRTARSTT